MEFLIINALLIFSVVRRKMIVERKVLTQNYYQSMCFDYKRVNLKLEIFNDEI